MAASTTKTLDAIMPRVAHVETAKNQYDFPMFWTGQNTNLVKIMVTCNYVNAIETTIFSTTDTTIALRYSVVS